MTLWLRRLGFSGLEWEALECDECTDPSDGTLPDEFGSKDGGVADILLTLAPLRSSDVLTSKVIFVIQSFDPARLLQQLFHARIVLSQDLLKFVRLQAMRFPTTCWTELDVLLLERVGLHWPHSFR